MRIGGLASGIDTETIIKQLMDAERIPLDKMGQDKTKLEWQRDAFRDLNKKLLELDNMMLDMKLSKTYNSKSIVSTMEGAVTATATAGASNGTYKINVKELASAAINVGEELGNDFDVDAPLGSQSGPIVFTTFDKDGEAQVHSYDISETDSLKDVMKRINDDPDNNVRMTYDNNAKKVILETTRTGNYNENEDIAGGSEIVFGKVVIEGEGISIEDGSDSFFTGLLKMNQGNEQGGDNAKFTYNDAYEVISKDNNYTLNGISFQFNDTTDGKNANLTINNDVDAAFDNIMAFVDKYNEVVELFNGSQQETRYRDFPPLTDAQREEMSEKEIELWEEKAKSGLLKGEGVITNGLFSMRQGWYSSVETGGQFTTLTQIGISTSKDYLDGGKLIVDEEDLRAALQEDPAGVQKLFSNSEEGASRGLVNRLEDAVESTMKRINQSAGKGTDTLENYTIGKRMKDLDNRIGAFEDKLKSIEDRYWRQFSAMEQAISRMNNQSAMLMNAFGGGMM
ncbi:flagellar hook-associated protein 2 [Oceanobacillus polygoni]|uniref:Flagellar hook-associated protein 2 n=1 Tax=Oceanobacillus polygoni TaxID=1235259 RepID=A0A9X0YXP1_9BACI|nr:flagellar hook-associated protein 2 [Oceanobacillus polygoni]MBP2078914.1 flagellar hook-associated protein 2 [Oceanobacillus polygoni]